MQGYTRRDVVRDGVTLATYRRPGAVPFVFQHGLCGDAAQPAEVMPEGAAHFVMECRGHGQSEAGPMDRLSIRTFADDLAAVMEGPAIVGGISMGAAIALDLAARRPDLVRALVIARPAWLDADGPPNMEPNAAVGQALLNGGTAEAFQASGIGRTLAAQAPDNLASLLGFFDREPRDVTAALLTRISADGPRFDPAALTMPVLVIGHEADLIHPMSHARDLAAMITTARLAEIPPKVAGKPAYIAAFRAALSDFIKDLADA